MSAGFGQIRLYLKDGMLRCSSEAMSRDFVKAVLTKLIDDVPLDEEEQVREYKQRLLAEGGCVDAEQIAAELDMSPEKVDEVAFGVQTDDGTWKYPRWQIRLRGFPEVLRVLEVDVEAHSWSIMAFFIDDEVDSTGTTALEALRKGDLESVLRAARAFRNQGAT